LNAAYSCIRVQNGYEKAVAAVLGDATEGVVLDRINGVEEYPGAHSRCRRFSFNPDSTSEIKNDKVPAEKALPGCHPIMDFCPVGC
jgi:hypothetical protein